MPTLLRVGAYRFFCYAGDRPLKEIDKRSVLIFRIGDRDRHVDDNAIVISKSNVH